MAFCIWRTTCVVKGTRLVFVSVTITDASVSVPVFMSVEISVTMAVVLIIGLSTAMSPGIVLV